MRAKGGKSERALQGHEKVWELYNKKQTEYKVIYENAGKVFRGLPLSFYYDEISDETGYSIESIRKILAESGNSNKTIRNLHKECLSLKRTSGVTAS